MSEESLELNVARLRDYKERLLVFPRKTRGNKGEKMTIEVLLCVVANGLTLLET